jgi:hypothetical protein
MSRKKGLRDSESEDDFEVEEEDDADLMTAELPRLTTASERARKD